MKKLLKKTVLILSLGLFLSAMVFAGGQSSPTPTSTSNELVVWLSEYQNSAFEDIQKVFLSQNPGVTISNVVMSVDDIYQRFLLAITAGTGMPDVIALESSHLAQYVQIGALKDITVQTQPYVNRILDFQWLDASMDGKRYAMPLDSGPVALYYRRDIFEQAGLPSSPEEVSSLLATWNDYYETAKIIKAKTGSYMFADSTELPSLRNFEKLMFQRGTWYFDSNNNITINNPQTRNILEFMKKFHTEGLMEDVPEWTQGWYDSFAKGTSATHFGAIWMSGFLKGWIAPETSGKWGIAPLPVWTAGGSRTANDGGSTLAIPAGSKNQDLAWKYIEFLAGRVESHASFAQRVDQFPSLIDSYSLPYFQQADPFYKDQQVLKVFTDAIVNAPKVAYTRNYSLANEIFSTVFLQYMYNDLSVDEALQSAENQIRQRMD